MKLCGHWIRRRPGELPCPCAAGPLRLGDNPDPMRCARCGGWTPHGGLPSYERVAILTREVASLAGQLADDYAWAHGIAFAPPSGQRPVDPDTGRPTDVGATTRKAQGSRSGPLAPRDCETCGQAYDPARKDQRFCSAACRAKHKNALHYRPAAEGKTAASPPAVPESAAPATGPGVDLPSLLGQLLAACDRWAIEADLGDIRVSVTRGCR